MVEVATGALQCCLDHSICCLARLITQAGTSGSSPKKLGGFFAPIAQRWI